VIFSLVFVASLAWVILLCLIIFWRWDISTMIQRALIISLLCANLVTAIASPLLLLLQFRMWLDISRLLLFLVLHIGSAAAFTYSSACPVPATPQKDVCKAAILYVILASWVNPLLLITYSVGLCYLLYRCGQVGAEIFRPSARDEEKSTDRASMSPSTLAHHSRSLPMVVPIFQEAYSTPPQSNTLPPWLTPSNSDADLTQSNQTHHAPSQSHFSSQSEGNRLSSQSYRLSKSMDSYGYAV
jgi:hypothetical protein